MCGSMPHVDLDCLDCLQCFNPDGPPAAVMSSSAADASDSTKMTKALARQQLPEGMLHKLQEISDTVKPLDHTEKQYQGENANFDSKCRELIKELANGSEEIITMLDKINKTHEDAKSQDQMLQSLIEITQESRDLRQKMKDIAARTRDLHDKILEMKKMVIDGDKKKSEEMIEKDLAPQLVASDPTEHSDDLRTAGHQYEDEVALLQRKRLLAILEDGKGSMDFEVLRTGISKVSKL